MAGLLDLVELTGKVIEYLKDVNEGSEDRRQLISELETVLNLYHQLKTQVEEEERKAPERPNAALQWLGKGPLEQMLQVLTDIAKKLGMEITPDTTELDQLQQNKPLSKGRGYFTNFKE